MHAFEKAPPDVQEILTKPIKELGLKLEGSPLERLVQQLYRELERKGLRKFRPLCYLSDEWGCPSGEPVIGIPGAWQPWYPRPSAFRSPQRGALSN